jgi:phosphoribosylcarboxyaminoimidazole (NCAIR) mutase
LSPAGQLYAFAKGAEVRVRVIIAALGGGTFARMAASMTCITVFGVVQIKALAGRLTLFNLQMPPGPVSTLAINRSRLGVLALRCALDRLEAAQVPTGPRCAIRRVWRVTSFLAVHRS